MPSDYIWALLRTDSRLRHYLIKISVLAFCSYLTRLAKKEILGNCYELSIPLDVLIDIDEGI